jgi:hypothetical protein
MNKMYPFIEHNREEHFEMWMNERIPKIEPDFTVGVSGIVVMDSDGRI